MLAEVYRSLGHPEAGLAALREALAVVETTGERSDAAARHRLTGAGLRQHAASTAFHPAFPSARSLPPML